MEQHVCPPWVGYLLLNPFRNFLENPKKMLGPYVREGMMVIEPGCGMGFFTLPIARMAGPSGRVVVVDVQAAMLEKVKKRTQRAGLADRIDCRLVKGPSLEIDDLTGKADFTAALHVVHEVPDQELFFREIVRVLKTGSRLLVIEPKHHVSEEDFQKTISIAESVGLKINSKERTGGSRKAVFIKY